MTAVTPYPWENDITIEFPCGNSRFKSPRDKKHIPVKAPDKSPRVKNIYPWKPQIKAPRGKKNIYPWKPQIKAPRVKKHIPVKASDKSCFHMKLGRVQMKSWYLQKKRRKKRKRFSFIIKYRSFLFKRKTKYRRLAFLGKWSFVMMFPCWKLRQKCGFQCKSTDFNVHPQIQFKSTVFNVNPWISWQKWGLSLSWSNVKRKTNEACCSASAGLWAVRSWVHILPLPVIPEVTLGGHSNGSLTIPRCKIGIGLGLEIQSWLWGSLRTRESRARVMNPPWPWSPWAKSTEVQNREYQWLHKMMTCHRKKNSNKRQNGWILDAHLSLYYPEIKF